MAAIINIRSLMSEFGLTIADIEQGVRAEGQRRFADPVNASRQPVTDNASAKSTTGRSQPVRSPKTVTPRQGLRVAD
jgi:hypothetical protein